MNKDSAEYVELIRKIEAERWSVDITSIRTNKGMLYKATATRNSGSTLTTSHRTGWFEDALVPLKLIAKLVLTN